MSIPFVARLGIYAVLATVVLGAAAAHAQVVTPNVTGLPSASTDPVATVCGKVTEIRDILPADTDMSLTLENGKAVVWPYEVRGTVAVGSYYKFTFVNARMYSFEKVAGCDAK